MSGIKPIEVKQGWRRACIYRIVNFVTGDFYIGSCVAPWERSQRHRTQLKQGKHGNRILQRAFDKYGIASFQFEILRSFPIEDVPRDVLYRLEQDYIDRLKPVYNIALDVAIPPPLSEENRAALTYRVSKTWTVTLPDGSEKIIHNLSAFCREMGLIKRCMQLVADGKMRGHRGWLCRRETVDKQPYVSRQGRCYVVDCPDGGSVYVKNLALYCREHGLSYNAMVSTLHRPHYHKGYLCHRPIHEHDKAHSFIVWPE